MLTDEEVADLVIAWLPPGGTVLDVGCGSGSTVSALVARNVEAMGIDPHAYSRQAPCRRIAAEQIASLSEQFDLVYTLYSLHHFRAPQQFIRDARQVLKSDSVLLILDWVQGAYTGVSERYFSPTRVASWVREADYELVHQEVRGQTMIIVGRNSSAERR
ncbi:MAG TPA: methyltransferase domain-containing protein [Anaerolineae bacterium]|nr:methyltransferase domain-containing protein [Anaerolineae bacterium]